MPSFMSKSLITEKHFIFFPVKNTTIKTQSLLPSFLTEKEGRSDWIEGRQEPSHRQASRVNLPPNA